MLRHKCACANACVIRPSGHTTTTKNPTATTAPTGEHPTKDPTGSKLKDKPPSRSGTYASYIYLGLGE